MPHSHRSPSPDIAALRAATEGICGEFLGHARKQAGLIRSGAAGELTEADVERMAEGMAAAARAQFEAAVKPYQCADPELQADCREAAQLMAATARQADAELRKAWQARRDKVAGRRWRR